METYKRHSSLFALISFFILSALVVIGCGGGGGGGASVNTPAPLTAPTIVFTAPTNTEIAVPINRKVVATFSTAMNPATITAAGTFILTHDVLGVITPVAGTVAYTGTTATFTPGAALDASELYTATVTTAAKDLAGTAMAANRVWTFTTSAGADVTVPTVLSVDPADTSVGVAMNKDVSAIFSETMDPLTIDATSFTVTYGAAIPVGGAISYVGTTAVFNPIVDFNATTLYTANISTGVTDLAGIALAAPSVWSFTTGATLAQGPSPILLGTSGNFAILTKTGITDVTPSAITGHIGSSPITGAAIGVTCVEMAVGSNIYSVDAAGPLPCSITDPVMLTTAVSDMETAYTTAAGRTQGVGPYLNVGAGTLTNQTLAPGTYTWGTNVTIPTDLTLTGGPNDVYLFQISGTLDISSARQVLLPNGALPKNIFWQVSGAVTLNSTSHFAGVILGQTKIDLITGATIDGRLLAQTAVNLDQNTIVQPAP
jgi:hypothetical protein